MRSHIMALISPHFIFPLYIITMCHFVSLECYTYQTKTLFMSFSELAALEANLKGQAELNSHPTQGPAVATASSEEDPFGTIRTTGKHKVRTVVVKCHEDSLEVVINADLFGHGWSVEPTHLRLGPVGESGDQCKVLVPPGNEEYTIKAQLSECGTEIMFVEDAVIFRNHLVYTPTPPLPGDVWQIKGVTIPIHCIYRRRYRVSSHALIPTLINTQSTHLDLHFHLKLMTNDWARERDSSVYFLGDVVHIQAAVAVAVQLPLRLYIDSCVATLSPDVNSYPRYAFIDHQGCFTDAQLTGSSSRFLPRVWDELLHIRLQPFLFRRDARNTIYITCYIEAVITSKGNPVKKACSFTNGRWKSADGDDHLCGSCGNHKGARPAGYQDMKALRKETTLRPFVFLPWKAQYKGKST